MSNMSTSIDVDVVGLVDIGCDGREACALIDSLVRGVRLQALTVKDWFILLYQRVLLTLSVLTFFSGVRIEVGEFCNSLTEVPCC